MKKKFRIKLLDHWFASISLSLALIGPKKTRKRMCMCKNLICIVYVCVTQLLLLLEFYLSGTHTHTHILYTLQERQDSSFFFFLLYVQFDSIGSVPEKVVEKKFKFEFKNHNDIKESAIDHKKIVGPSQKKRSQTVIHRVFTFFSFFFFYLVHRNVSWSMILLNSIHLHWVLFFLLSFFHFFRVLRFFGTYRAGSFCVFFYYNSVIHSVFPPHPHKYFFFGSYTVVCRGCYRRFFFAVLPKHVIGCRCRRRKF